MLQGYSDTKLERMVTRGRTVTRNMAKREDERVNHLPLQFPPPGKAYVSCKAQICACFWHGLPLDHAVMPSEMQFYVFIARDLKS